MAVYGSLINQLSSGPTTKEPEVGQGATILGWTDRYPATIVKVEYYKSGPQKGKASAVWITADEATRIDSNGQSDAQSYTYETVEGAPQVKYTKRKSGKWVRAGDKYSTLAIGYRDKYYDYSF